MTSKVKKLYDSGLKNDRFVNILEDADGDKNPSFFTSENEKIIFATIYYGWLLSEYGLEWESQI